MINLKRSKERCKIFRKKILEISQTVPALHIGGSFSSVEILDVIYNEFLKRMISLFYPKAMLEFCNMLY